MKTPILYLLCIALWGIYAPARCSAYSVLSHEAIIDASWDKGIQPLLLKKYPNATAEQLKEARSYAYGGSVAPDMGYFPLGNKLFTNLVHYVRSGDFVTALLEEEQNINEYAFALGVLAHYYADNYGHPLGVNPGVPIVYPKIKKKYGDVVTYAQNKISHRRMELGFDVLQTARGNYASQSYHDFIGFNVARPVLERAFLKTYGLDINDLFANLSLSISTFRWSVSRLFPQITRIAWSLRSAQIKKEHPGTTGHSFRYRMRRGAYKQEFGKQRERPGLFAGMASMTFRIVPKRLLLRSMRFKEPGKKAEALFVKSFETILTEYADGMKKIGAGHDSFNDLDYDTGKPTANGEYALANDAYHDLLIKLQKKDFDHLTPSLKQNILAFYSEPANGNNTKDDEVTGALAELKKHKATKKED